MYGHVALSGLSVICSDPLKEPELFLTVMVHVPYGNETLTATDEGLAGTARPVASVYVSPEGHPRSPLDGTCVAVTEYPVIALLRWNRRLVEGTVTVPELVPPGVMAMAAARLAPE